MGVWQGMYICVCFFEMWVRIAGVVYGGVGFAQRAQKVSSRGVVFDEMGFHAEDAEVSLSGLSFWWFGFRAEGAEIFVKCICHSECAFTQRRGGFR